MTEQTAISAYLSQDNVNQSIRNVLGSRSGQFVTSVAAVVNSNTQLQQADRKSILMACLTAASLDLPINQNLGFAYIIPYNDRKNNQVLAQFQAGYKAYIQLSQRSGQMVTINTTDVREGEIEDFDRLSGEYVFKWLPESEREKAKIVGYAAYFKLKNGFSKTLYMTSDELQKHGVKYSQTAKRGFGLWVDEFDSMAKKTVLKLLLQRYAPLSADMAKAIEADQAVIRDEGQYEYVDNQPIDARTEGEARERDRLIRNMKQARTVDDLERIEKYLTDDDLKKMYRQRKAALEATTRQVKGE
jgi:recombination protein RecT